MLSISDLVTFVSGGYSAKNFEEEVFQALNEKYNQETGTFNELIDLLKRVKTM